MGSIFNVYCDESCHLEHDASKVMTLGAIWCPTEKSQEIATRLREIKAKHGLLSSPEGLRPYELKWNQVSQAKIQYYTDVLDYFFDDDDLHFRALVIPDKTILRHTDFNQSHELWYYKMYFELIRGILDPVSAYNIYLDYKDTHGAERVSKLDEVLRNKHYDFSRRVVRRLQIVRSHEVEQLQLADLLIGVVTYANRELNTSLSKVALVQKVREKSKYHLTRTTLLRENKVNIFVWSANTGSEMPR